MDDRREKELLEQNPDYKSQLDNLPRSFRDNYISQLLKGLEKGGSSISFQPTSFLRVDNGKKLKFLPLQTKKLDK